jgi:hypothetical protein
MNVTAERTSKMDDIEVRVKEMIAQYGDLMQGGEAQTTEFKNRVQDFIDHGPGMSEQRRQALFRHMKGWDTDYVAFLTRRD